MCLLCVRCRDAHSCIHLVVCPAAALSAPSASNWPFSAAGSLAPSATKHIYIFHNNFRQPHATVEQFKFGMQIKLKWINSCRWHTFNQRHFSLLQMMMMSLNRVRLLLQSGVYLYMCKLTSLSLKVTQSLILAAFSSIIFASWALTTIWSQKKQNKTGFVDYFKPHFMNINGHFYSLSEGFVLTCFSSCISNLFITASFSWTWLVRSWNFLYNKLSDSLVCMFADFSFSSMTWIWNV